MEWLPDYGYMKEHGVLAEGTRLRKDVDSRIGWEIISEYGFQARIGRTLEKTGSSVAYFDPTLTQRIVKQMLEPIRNEIGGFRALDENRLTRFLLGFLAPRRLELGNDLRLDVIDFWVILEAFIHEDRRVFPRLHGR